MTTEYTYDPNGSILTDQNKGVSSITYNVLGKASVINFADGRKIEYTYDAAGNKLTMKNYQGTTLLTTTDYAGSYVYENSVLSFFGSPEGRVVKKASVYEYEYSIADHQGNTRVVFTSVTPAAVAPVSTLEGDANDGSSQYTNVVAGNVVSFTAANHTTGGIKVVRMNQTYKIGPSKSVKVYPGDKIDMEVWEYHEGNSGFGTTSTPLTTLVTMVAGAFGGVSGGVGDPGLIYNGVNSALNGFLPAGNQGSARPAAYLNYILFDKDYKVLDMGWQLAPATTFTKQKLSFPTLNVKEAGYVFVYLSYDNDSNNWVYFDDMKVTHTKSNILQYNEYYPFGLQTNNSWTREGNKNDFLYNAGNELNATSGWYETYFRGYDAALGKFLQTDPKADKYGSWSPYNYGFNDPVFYNDPLGDDADNPVVEIIYQDASTGPDEYNYEIFGEAWDAFARADAFSDGNLGISNPQYNSMVYGSAGGVGGATSQSSGFGARYGGGHWETYESSVWKDAGPNTRNPKNFYKTKIYSKRWVEDDEQQEDEVNPTDFDKGPIPEYHFLYQSDEKDIFGQRITYQNGSLTVIVKTVAVVTFGYTGSQINGIKGITGFTITTKVRDGKVTHEGSLLNSTKDGKIIIPPGLSAFIHTIENFSRPKGVLEKYYNFILSPVEERRHNNNIVTSTDR